MAIQYLRALTLGTAFLPIQRGRQGTSPRVPGLPPQLPSAARSPRWPKLPAQEPAAKGSAMSSRRFLNLWVWRRGPGSGGTPRLGFNPPSGPRKAAQTWGHGERPPGDWPGVSVRAAGRTRHEAPPPAQRGVLPPGQRPREARCPPGAVSRSASVLGRPLNVEKVAVTQ